MDLSPHLSKDRLNNVICLDTLQSTNTYLKAMASAPDRTVVTADSQTGGRGRYDRAFHSPKGGIYMSYLFRNPVYDPRYLTAVCGVCIKRCIESHCGVSLGIKWVNDLILNGKKICGILAESVIDNQGTRTVVGIGINVNTQKSDFAGELSQIASSLYVQTGKTFDKDRLCAEIIKALDDMDADIGQYLDEYRKSCITLGKDVYVFSQNSREEGTVLSLNDDFSLDILMKSGEKRTVISGEVTVKAVDIG